MKVFAGGWVFFVIAGLSAILGANAASAQASLVIDRERVDAGQGWAVGFSEGGSGCIATARYKDGTRVWLGVSARSGRYIAFSNPAWRSIVEGGGYEVRMLAGGSSWRVETEGLLLTDGPTIISRNIKLEVLEDIAHASSFSLELAGRKIFGGELSGSRRALNLAFQCFERNKSEAERIAANRSPTPNSRPNSGPPQMAGNGTGFFVRSDGLILTNEHVTKGCRSIMVGVPGNEFTTAAVKATDAVNDLTLLKIAAGPSAVPSFRTSLKMGEGVAVFGYPLSNYVATAGNFTMGYISAQAGLANDTREYQISAPVQPGNSGGPMIDHMGNVVGIINSKLNALSVALKQGDIPQNINFAIKASVALNFLETNGITLQAPAASKKLEPTELAEHLRSFSVKVDCYK